MAEIRPIRADAESALLVLNNDHAVETSLLDAQSLRRMCERAFLAAFVGNADAMLIAFDQHADYASLNFLWFRERFDRFVYVDRIITARAARGRGLARLLYAALFEKAAACGHDRIVCEVNLDPPNPASDRFHDALGFAEVGRATLAVSGKKIRYLSCTIGEGN